MGAATAKKNRRRGKRARGVRMAEINVTPFVDVMLVLLIVFMVTAPLLVQGVAVDLPKAEAKQLPADQSPLMISIRADGTIFIGGAREAESSSLEELTSRLEGLAKAGYDQRIFIRADANTTHGRVSQVIAKINSAGYRNIGIVTDSAAIEREK
jgi:biopolymer transport protein TolR